MESSHAARANRSTVLTAREWQVAELITRGQSYQQIGAELVIACGTVERHVANIMSKLGVQSRAQIAAWTTERRWRGDHSAQDT